MKRLLTLVAALFCYMAVFAQTPAFINYQAVARSASGAPLANQNITVRLSIIDSIATGDAVYIEKHHLTTNEFGLFVLQIGGGAAEAGVFTGINWGLNAKYLKVEMDPAGGSTYTLTGTSQFVSVPYSLVSGRAIGTSLNDLVDVATDTPAISQVLTWSGTTWVPATAPQGYWAANGNNINNTNVGEVVVHGAPQFGYRLSVANDSSIGSIYASYGQPAGSPINSAAIVGSSAGSDGVAGLSFAGNGVSGVSSTGNAVSGLATGGNGVAGSSTDGNGGYLVSTNSNGLFAASTNNIGAIIQTYDASHFAGEVLGTSTSSKGLYVQGKTGINTGAPQQALDVAGAINIADVADASGTAGAIRYHANTFQGYNGTSWQNFGGGSGSQSLTLSGNTLGITGGNTVILPSSTNYWTQAGNNITNNNSGTVSVNAAPHIGFKLNVANTESTADTGAVYIALGAPANAPSTSKSALFATSHDYPALIGLSDNSDVIIGISSNATGVHGLSNAGVGVAGYSLNSIGSLGSSDSSYGGEFYSANGTGMYTITNSPSHFAAFIDGTTSDMGLHVMGKTGLGTSTPQQMLDVNGAVNVGDIADATGTSGAIRYHSGSFQGYNGTSWQSFGSSNPMLTLTGSTLGITGGNTVNLSSINTDAQTLSVSGNSLSISGGNSVTLPAASSYWTQTGNNIANNNTGTVSINSAPHTAYKLSVKNTQAASDSGALLAVYGTPSSSYLFHNGAITATSANHIAVSGISDSATALYGNSQYGRGVDGFSNESYGVAGYSDDTAGVYGSSFGSLGGLFTSVFGTALRVNTSSGNFAAKIEGSLLGLQVTGKTGLGTATPAQMLDVNGAVSVGDIADALGTAGAIRYHSGTFQGYNGGSWQAFGGGSSPWSSSGTNVSLVTSTNNVGIGTATPLAKLEVKSGAILADGSTGATPTSGAGTRLMWIPGKNAFRAGNVTGTAWDDASVGLGSWAGGTDNIVSGSNSFAHGSTNTVTGSNSAVFGLNNTSAQYQSIVSGQSNIVTGAVGNGSAFGQSNYVAAMAGMASGSGDSVLGTFGIALGNTNTAGGYSSIALGDHSKAYGGTSVAIGNQCVASGTTGSTAIGWGNTASGAYSTALGVYTSTNGMNGALVMGDNPFFTGDPFSQLMASTTNQFSARFSNGYRLYTDLFLSTGVQLTPGGSSWSFVSDSTRKTNFRKVDGEYVLNSMHNMKAGTWNYKTQDPKGFRHYGPMAQEFFHFFGHDELGTVGCDTLIASADMEGILFIAVKALEERTRELQKAQQQLGEMEKKYATLEQRLGILEASLEKKESKDKVVGK